MALNRAIPRRRIVLNGVRIGHATAPDGSTGVTAVLFVPAASVVVDVRGGASCTYDTASLSVDATFGRRWAIFFAGGSVFGLDAARGIRTAMLSSGAGHRPFVNPNRVLPISGATLFDLPTTEGPITDYLPLGFEAARSAGASTVAVGRVGAGAGTTVGKYLGREKAMPGGLGYAAETIHDLGRTAALVVLNSVGAVRDSASGRWIAGARGSAGRVVPPGPGVPSEERSRPTPRGTNLVLVVTSVALDRMGLSRLAQQAHDGLARAIVPAHTSTDGDVAFAASTSVSRRRPPEQYPGAMADRVGTQAARLVSRAAVVAIRPFGR